MLGGGTVVTAEMILDAVLYGELWRLGRWPGAGEGVPGIGRLLQCHHVWPVLGAHCEDPLH